MSRRNRQGVALLTSGVAWFLATIAPGAAALAATPKELYDTHCSLCHQAGAAGAAAQFPKLAGRAGALAADAKGRSFLVSVVRNGLSGTITIDGAPLTGVMPAQPGLEAQDLAQILNYLASLPPTPRTKPKLFAAAEVTSLSAVGALSREQLMAQRQALVESHVLP
jgi:mono/diheme cytochrome c family protein